MKQRNWYCRVKLPNADRYETVSLQTADIDAAKERAFDQDADVRFHIKHEVPIFIRAVAKAKEPDDFAPLERRMTFLRTVIPLEPIGGA